MKRIIILTLLLFTAAFSLAQTNQTVKNLDVKGKERVYGPLYLYDTVYFKTTNANIPFLPTGDPLGWVLGTQKNTGKLVRVPMANLSDSTCLFYLVGDTIKTNYHVKVDSSFTVYYVRDTAANYINANGWDIEIGAFGLPSTNGASLNINPTGASLNAGGTSEVAVYPDSIYITSGSVIITGDLTVTGQVKYDFKHLVAYLTAGSYTPNVSTNTPFKLVPTMTISENDGMTFAGDSITIITPGDYKLDLAGVMSAEGANWKITVRKNGVLFTSGHCAFTTTGSSIYNTFSWFYYFPGLAAGDDISFYITNETGSNDPTFRAFKIYTEMKPE